jgi:hypothetical protein
MPLRQAALEQLEAGEMNILEQFIHFIRELL